MRAIAGILMLALLLAPLPEVSANPPTAAWMTLDLDSAEGGEIRLTLGWWSGPWEDFEGIDWYDLRARYRASGNYTLTNSWAMEELLRYLTGPLPNSNDTPALANAILGTDAVATATIDNFEVNNDYIYMVISFDFKPADDVELHPLMFVSQLENGTALLTFLKVTYPPDTALTTNEFVLEHIRTPTGNQLGRADFPFFDSVAYDPAEGEMTLAAAAPWADGRVMAGAVALQLLLIGGISYRLGGGRLRPLLFWAGALLAFIFVSFPFSTGLCYGIILFGLARQYLHALEARELARDMDGFVDALLSRPSSGAGASPSGSTGNGSYQLQELYTPRNPLARLFPFKVQELFLIYDDGRLISHAALHGSQLADSEIVSSMLTAISDFIKDSFRADDESGLENLKYGNLNLLVQRRRPLYLAGVISGTPPDDFGAVLKEFLDELWDEYGYTIGRNWNGDTSSLAPLAGELSRFITYWSSTH